MCYDDLMRRGRMGLRTDAANAGLRRASSIPSAIRFALAHTSQYEA